MLEWYNTTGPIKTMVDQFTWYILPVFNRDGYEYTFEGGDAVIIIYCTISLVQTKGLPE